MIGLIYSTTNYATSVYFHLCSYTHFKIPLPINEEVGDSKRIENGGMLTSSKYKKWTSCEIVQIVDFAIKS